MKDLRGIKPIQAAMPRRLKFDVRKRASRQKSNLLAKEIKRCCDERPVTSDAETQTDLQHCNMVDSSVQALVELDTATIGTQTDDLQEQCNAAVDCGCQTDDATESVDAVNTQGRLCEGILDEKFRPLVLKCSGVFKDSMGKVIGYFDSAKRAIYHAEWLKSLSLDSQAMMCSQCSLLRENVLRGRLSRHVKELNNESQSISAISHTNFRYLTTPQKRERMKNMASVIQSKDHQISYLKERIEKLLQRDGICVDSNTHVSMMRTYSKDVQGDTPNPFMKIFWEQQLKAATLTSTRQIRWHPAIIRWCLYLHHRSSGCYKTLRSSGIFHLPSESTLRDYRHFAPSSIGFSKELDQQLIAHYTNQKPEHLAKYVGIVLDQMYVKESLVFDKHTGSLTGCADLGEVNNLFTELEEEKKNGTQKRPLAKCILVFMIRGLFTSLKFPYVHFPASSTKGTELFPILRKVISRLTRLGLEVLTVTCDGASENRLLFSLHDEKNDKTAYKIKNVYAKTSSSIYFISDPSHLIKTIRNCFSRGKLWCNGQHINWQFLIQLYESNAGRITETPGLSMVHKLKYEHLHLTSFSKMRVDLAVQTLSESVSKALLLKFGDDARETAKFIKNMDHFFDCFNVSSFTAGKEKRKAFLAPYRSSSDFQFKFLEELIKYLDQWKASVDNRQGFTPEQKQHMILSCATDNGMRITVKSFMELVPLLLKIDGVTAFLSEKLSQDPLEKFFGIQRQQGRANENPTVAQVLKNSQSLRVINSIWVKDITGNCRGCKRKS